MKAIEVFTPGKSPSITYVDDQLIERKDTLLDALEMGAAVISLSGPSKSGKTVFIEKTIGKDRLLSLDGTRVDDTNKLWNRVLDLIGKPISTRKTDQKAFRHDESGKVSGGISGLIKAEAGTLDARSDSQSTTDEYAPDYFQLVVKELSGTKFVIFIDDFHYIEKGLQVELSNQIKVAIAKDVNIICASVPYRSDDVIRANRDLRGRLTQIDFTYWDQDEIKKNCEKRI